MTSTEQVVKDIIVAINNVTRRARDSFDHHDLLEAEELVGDIISLHCCLVTEVTKLIEEQEEIRKSLEKAG